MVRAIWTTSNRVSTVLNCVEIARLGDPSVVTYNWPGCCGCIRSCAVVDALRGDSDAAAATGSHFVAMFRIGQSGHRGLKPFQLFRILQAYVCLHANGAQFTPVASGNWFEHPPLVF